jgi:hypothetical protein
MFETHVEDLVRADHPYRKLLNAIDFKKLCKPLHALFHETLGRKELSFSFFPASELAT